MFPWLRYGERVHKPGPAPRRRSPAWTRDEIILVAAQVVSNRWHELREGDPEARELSDLLRSLDIHPPEARTGDFRSPGSVSRKSSDIATAYSGYAGVPTRGGALTREVVREFERDPRGMAKLAREVDGQATAGGELPGAGGVPDPDLGVPAAEGGARERVHLSRERDSRIRNAKVASVLKRGGKIVCEVCGFDFGAVYGSRGDGYIEVHHRIPLHVSGPTETSLEDLALLCSNCHRMIHRDQPWLTVEQLASTVAERRALS